MNQSWLEGNEAPWLGQQAAAKAFQASGSPFMPKDKRIAKTERLGPYDPSRYWAFFSATD